MRKLAKKTITADTSMGTQSDRMETMRTSRLGARACRAGAGARVRQGPLVSAPPAGEQGAGAAVKPERRRRERARPDGPGPAARAPDSRARAFGPFACL